MLYIVWNPKIELFTIGSFSLLWYGVLFAVGLIAAGGYIYGRCKESGVTERQFNALVLLLFIGIFLGARLCHCIFYDPGYFFSHPLEIFLPITTNAEGDYYFCGYHGLASHGGGVGAIIAILIYKLMYRQVKLLPILDIVAIATPLLGGFIRLENFVNSEILGTSTTLPWAVIFSAVDEVPRHPVQIYEALFYFLLFFVLAAAYRFVSKKEEGSRIKSGFWFSLVLIFIPLFRFFVEYCKMEQISYSAELPLNMGQLLSIPLLLAGVIVLLITQYSRGKSSEA